METISVSLRPETIEALSTEAEIREFESRSEYIRHIVENRGQIDSIDNNDVDIIEQVAQSIEKRNNEKIKNLEDGLHSLMHDLEEMHDLFDEIDHRYDYLQEMEGNMSEMMEKSSELTESISNIERGLNQTQSTVRENKREIRDNRTDINELRKQISEINQR